MLNRYGIKVVWGNRREDIAACAKSVVRTLEKLSQIDSKFELWQGTKGKSRVLLNPCDHDQCTQEVESLLAQGVNRTDFGGREVIQELGFTISLSTPGQGDLERASLACTCGAYARTERVASANIVTVSLPFSGPTFDRLSEVNVLVNTLGELVREWRPDRGAVESSNHALERTREQGGAELFVSWLLYLPVPVSQFPALQPPSRVEAMGAGSVVVVTDELFDPTRKDHVEAAARVQRLLVESGVLKPLPISSPS